MLILAHLFRMGGIMGCVASVFTFYAAAAGLLTDDTSFYALPAIELPKRRTAEPRY